MPGLPLRVEREHGAQGAQGRGLADVWAGCDLSGSWGITSSAVPGSQALSTAETCPHVLLLPHLAQPPRAGKGLAA